MISKCTLFYLVFSFLILLELNLVSCQESKDWQAGPFIKIDSVNPILYPLSSPEFFCPILKSRVAWEKKDVFNPAAVLRLGKVYLIYRAQDSIGKPGGTSRLGLASSSDGLHFTRLPKPVFYPSNDTMKKYEWEGGCEDPRIVQDSLSTYWMTYTAFDGKIARMAIASSTDLLHWKKHGLAFASASGGKYLNSWSKSGSIICVLKNGSFQAQKIAGKYWMYWGDDSLKIATSSDLINWQPLLNTKGQFISVARPRKGMFDSRLCEPGPPALIIRQGIRLIYNGMNASTNGDSQLAPGAYSGGQLLLDSKDPTKVISRLSNPFIKPDKPYELAGQVNKVCFLEGMVPLKGKWYLYYGTADSRIAVCRSNQN